MRDRSKRISNLIASVDSRASYIRSKLSVLVPSQIRSLRLKSDMPRQADLAVEAKMHQSQISMFETPGAANLTLDTLSRLAAAFNVGLVVKFVPFSEMLRWENDYSQDSFDVTRLDHDVAFLQPNAEPVRNAVAGGIPRPVLPFTAQDSATELVGIESGTRAVTNEYAALPSLSMVLGGSKNLAGTGRT